MNTRNPLTRRYEVHFDKMTDAQVIKFLDAIPNKPTFLRELVMREFRKYKRAPYQYAQNHGFNFVEAKKQGRL